MWCSTCQQDVPQPAWSGGATGPRCGRCGQLLGIHDAAKLVSVVDRAAWLLADDSALDAQVRGALRLVAALKPHGGSSRLAAMHGPGWLTGPPIHATSQVPTTLDFQPPAGAETDRESSNAPGRRSSVPRERMGASAAAGLALLTGLATLTCGAVLLAWSLLAGRKDLWPIGVPLALLGQAGLILGLLLQVNLSANRMTKLQAPVTKE